MDNKKCPYVIINLFHGNGMDLEVHISKFLSNCTIDVLLSRLPFLINLNLFIWSLEFFFVFCLRIVFFRHN